MFEHDRKASCIFVVCLFVCFLYLKECYILTPTINPFSYKVTINLLLVFPLHMKLKSCICRPVSSFIIKCPCSTGDIHNKKNMESPNHNKILFCFWDSLFFLYLFHYSVYHNVQESTRGFCLCQFVLVGGF